MPERRAVFHRKYILTSSAAAGAIRNKGKIVNQSFNDNGIVPKTCCRNGTYNTPSINTIDDTVANNIHLLENNPIEKTK